MFSLKPVIVVLDINGVLADVRRHEAPRINERIRVPDVMLPNKQRVYLNPACLDLFQWLDSQTPNVVTVMFTSRAERNAMPIETLLRDKFVQYRPVLSLHGEDCGHGGCAGEPWRPQKSSHVVTRRIGGSSPSGGRSSIVIFVDDNPERLVLGVGSKACPGVTTYDALKVSASEAKANMATVIANLEKMISKD